MLVKQKKELGLIEQKIQEFSALSAVEAFKEKYEFFRETHLLNKEIIHILNNYLNLYK